MRRFWLVVGTAMVIVGALWLVEDNGFRRSIGIGEFGPVATAERPSWGDVANRVGEFAREEQQLKAVIGAVQSGGDPAPQQ
jgi:hypothetical protein